MRRVALGTVVAVIACTDPGTDPNAVVAIRFDGSAYPSIVVGDSLRDSLGALQPVRASGLNFKGNPVADAKIVFSSPDTNLRVLNTGSVFARSRKTDGSPARLFATVGSLQSQPDSLLTVPRADSIKATVEADTAFGASLSDADLTFSLFGDTVANKPKLVVPGWLVSFRVRYRGVELDPTDTTIAFACRVTSRRILSTVDTTDASGRAGRRLCLRGAPRSPADTAFLIATSRLRKVGSDPISAEIRLLFLPGVPPTTRVTTP
jgi:hypothetical protein